MSTDTHQDREVVYRTVCHHCHAIKVGTRYRQAKNGWRYLPRPDGWGPGRDFCGRPACRARLAEQQLLEAA